jgi:lysophospholipase L1-like esterase
MWRALPLLLLFSLIRLFGQQQPMINLVLFGDSLTEGVPHLNGEPDTYGFMVSQQFQGSTYVKLGYRGQTTAFLQQHLDSFLFTLLKPGSQNVLVLWAGTNDCALDSTNCVQPVFDNLVAMAKIAHAAGWQVVVVTMIARGNYFSSPAQQNHFTAAQTQINYLLKSSNAFDAVADPAPILTDPTNSTYYWDGCHLWPAGYQIVANLVALAIRGLPQGTATPGSL